MTDSNITSPGAAESLQRLQRYDREALVRMLHDDIGQSLVAIRSIACALLEQPGIDADQCAELAELIHQSSDSAYRSVYDLMQELRVQELAREDLEPAIERCLGESRLDARRIDFEIQSHDDLGATDEDTRGLMLRSLCNFVNACKRVASAGRLRVQLSRLESQSRYGLRLQMDYAGDADAALLDLERYFDDCRGRIESIGGAFNAELDDPRQFMVRLDFEYLTPAKPDSSR